MYKKTPLFRDDAKADAVYAQSIAELKAAMTYKKSKAYAKDKVYANATKTAALVYAHDLKSAAAAYANTLANANDNETVAEVYAKADAVVYADALIVKAYVNALNDTKAAAKELYADILAKDKAKIANA